MNTKLGASLPEVRCAFAMSKMTVRDEIAQEKEYSVLHFCEWVEFLGRLAHVKWTDQPSLQLDEKL